MGLRNGLVLARTNKENTMRTICSQSRVFS